MPVTKLNISLEAKVASQLRKRAAEQGKTMSRYLSELILQDARSSTEELAGEGYRVMGRQGLEFAEQALPLAAESWTGSDAHGPGTGAARRSRGRKAASR